MMITPDREINSTVLELINKDILRFTCQLFILNSDQPEPYGSGVFAKLGDSYYILTASHVAEYIRDAKRNLYVRAKVKDGYVNVVGSVKGTEMNIHGVDLAYIKVNESFLREIHDNFKFLPISKFRAHNKLVNLSQYCVVGFPEKNSWVQNRSLITGANAYILEPSRENVYKYYKLKPEVNYLLDIKGKGTDLAEGTVNRIYDGEFHGISGCGLWLLMPHTNEGELKIDYRLIGIMTEFRKGEGGGV